MNLRCEGGEMGRNEKTTTKGEFVHGSKYYEKNVCLHFRLLAS